MKSLLILGLFVTVVWTNPLAKKHEDFKIQILEKGVEFEQDVDLDEEEHIVSVHVPAHNDIDETYFITDTRKHLTMKVAPQKKMCFLMENDPEELPPVDVWRKTQEFTQNKIIEDDESSQIVRKSYMISGSLSPGEREDLPKRMREMCDGLPIVWTEEMNMPEDALVSNTITYINYTRMEESETKRFKRQMADGNIYIDDCPRDKYKQACVVTFENCYRILKCDTERDVGGRDGAACDKVNHLKGVVSCCKACCNAVVPPGNRSPNCDTFKTQEQICSGEIEILSTPSSG